MKRLRGWIILLLALIFAQLPAQLFGADTTTLRVFAAASLAGPFGEIARDFEAKHRGTKVQLNLAGSQQLAEQIEQGASADVFASADERWMSALQEKSLVQGEPQVFARNRLVVIVPGPNPARIGKLQDLTRPGVKIVVGAEAVPIGAYTRDVLRNLSKTDGYAASFGTKVLANVVSEEENVRSVVGKVQLGEADAGICYRSDITGSVGRYVKVIEIPESANVIASYPIAVLAKSASADLAREFVESVRSGDGQRTLERFGLIPVTRAP
jgi:molybdate transport system substrate-binding protein